MLEIQNLVKVTGSVKYIEKLAKSVRVTIRVMRPESELHYYRDRTKFDDIWFYFFPEDNNNLSEIMLGDVVTVTGHVTAPRKVRPDGTWYWSQAFIGDYIALCQDQSADQPGHGYVFLSGPVEQLAPIAAAPRASRHIAEAAERQKDILYLRRLQLGHHRGHLPLW